MFALVRAMEHSSMSLSAPGIEICEPIAVFAFFVFGVLLFLHILQVGRGDAVAVIPRSPNPKARRARLVQPKSKDSREATWTVSRSHNFPERGAG
jgi:hypothetical protein